MSYWMNQLKVGDQAFSFRSSSSFRTIPDQYKLLEVTEVLSSGVRMSDGHLYLFSTVRRRGCKDNYYPITLIQADQDTFKHVENLKADHSRRRKANEVQSQFENKLKSLTLEQLEAIEKILCAEPAQV